MNDALTSATPQNPRRWPTQIMNDYTNSAENSGIGNLMEHVEEIPALDTTTPRTVLGEHASVIQNRFANHATENVATIRRT
ncbi:hypothetical protein RB195_019745 [Necator americanus]|uniref:Zasp-like motif domain-containing protein n=1 Tax=Necator americanus TaxID=51031 RepID=A0ABR1CFL0_NECAM